VVFQTNNFGMQMTDIERLKTKMDEYKYKFNNLKLIVMIVLLNNNWNLLASICDSCHVRWELCFILACWMKYDEGILSQLK